MRVALGLFMQHGFDNTSIQAITDEVGVAKGLFYHYFESKIDLLDQLVDMQVQEFYAHLPDHAQDMDGDALSKIRAIIGEVVGWKFGEARDMTITYMRVLMRDENLPLRTKLTQEYLYRMEDLFAEIIEEGVEEGLCDVEDPRTSAELVFSTWLGSADRLSNLLLEMHEKPDNVEMVLDRVHAWEGAIERLLGIERDALKLYDYDFLRRTFTEMAATPDPDAGIPPPE